MNPTLPLVFILNHFYRQKNMYFVGEVVSQFKIYIMHGEPYHWHIQTAQREIVSS